jgi:hypothetical protein
MLQIRHGYNVPEWIYLRNIKIGEREEMLLPVPLLK